MEQSDYLKLLDGINQAENDTTPYAAVINNEIVVEGDPNNTKVVKQDYVAKFIFPTEMATAFPNAKKSEVDGYSIVEIEYNDVFVDVRNNLKYTTAMARTMPFFRKLEDSGDVSEMSVDEAIDLFASLEDDVVDALYHLVQVVLDVDDRLIGYMAVGSVIHIATRIVKEFPSIVNQGDLFFGLPTEKR